MVARTIKVELDEALDKGLRRVAHQRGEPEDQVVREAVARVVAETEAAPPDEGESALDVARRLGLLGCMKDLPADLSTNPKYMEGFGE